MGLGVAGARINAAGTVVGVTAPTMTFSNTGAIAFTGSGTRTLILGGATVADNTFRPQITDGGGATTLSKVDAGMWVINPGVSGNTYTGGTSITGGTLAILTGNALGSGTVTVNGGAGTGLELRGGITLANNVTNSAADGGLRSATGANILTGLLTISNQLRVDVASGASLTLSNATSAVTGSGTLLKLGKGNLVLSGTNGAAWTGATTVREAFLRAGEAGFRAAEAEALARALRRGEAHVLALGGGTPTAPGAAAQIAEARREGRALVVFLDPPLSTLAERLAAHEGDRPSLTGRGVVAEIGDVAAVRRPLYAALADLRLLEPLDEASLVSIITSQVGSASATADA
jgi:shikimate kinase